MTTHEIGFFPFQGEEFIEAIRLRKMSPDAIVRHFREIYRRFPSDHAEVFATVLQIISKDDALPALIHCTSGKDRTGFAVAVVLMALGVPRTTILQDYLLTNRYRRDLSFMLGPDTDKAVLSAVTQAQPDYLQVAFSAIDEVWGSEGNFLVNAMRFDTASQARLQELLLDKS